MRATVFVIDLLIVYTGVYRLVNLIYNKYSMFVK